MLAQQTARAGAVDCRRAAAVPRNAFRSGKACVAGVQQRSSRQLAPVVVCQGANGSSWCSANVDTWGVHQSRIGPGPLQAARAGRRAPEWRRVAAASAACPTPRAGCACGGQGAAWASNRLCRLTAGAGAGSNAGHPAAARVGHSPRVSAAALRAARSSDGPARPHALPPRAPSSKPPAAASEYKGDLLNKSYYPTAADASNANKRWYIIDAQVRLSPAKSARASNAPTRRACSACSACSGRPQRARRLRAWQGQRARQHCWPCSGGRAACSGGGRVPSAGRQRKAPQGAAAAAPAGAAPCGGPRAVACGCA